MDFDIYFTDQNRRISLDSDESYLLAYDLSKDILVALAVIDPSSYSEEMLEIENCWINRYEILGKKSLNHTVLTNEIFTRILTSNPAYSMLMVIISPKKVMTIGSFGGFRIERYRNKKWQTVYINQNENKIQTRKSIIGINDLLFISSKSEIVNNELLNQIKNLINVNKTSKLICQELKNHYLLPSSEITGMIGIIQIKS